MKTTDDVSILHVKLQLNEDSVSEWCVDVKLVEENERFSIQLFVNQHTKNTHHSSTAIVQLLGPQINHISFCLRKGPKSNGESSSRKVTRETSLLLFPQDLQSTSRQKDRDKVDGIDLENGIVSCREIFTSRESRPRPGGSISPSSKLGNAAVLELDVTEAIEASLISICDQVQWVPAAKFSRSGADFVVEGSGEGGDSALPLLSGGEGGGGSSEGCEDCGLHGGGCGFSI